MNSPVISPKKTGPSRLARSAVSALSLSLSSAMLLGCGYSEEEMQAQIDKYNQLAGQYQEEKDGRATAEADLEEMRKRVTDLKQKLEAAGMNLDALSSQMAESATEKERLAQSLQELQAALDEYKKRAAQLEAIQARFAELRKKLNQLVKIGLKVEIRHNRMVIRLPGDVLFDSGQTSLKKEGKDVIQKVADVIRNDSGLRNRYFQVAGHTDNIPLKGGRFGDNWGLSAMRAREVVLFLIDPKAGGLNPDKLNAAGYADIDPVAANDSADGRGQNRRVELVVVPDVSEMLDLGNMVEEPLDKGKGKKADQAPDGSDKKAASAASVDGAAI